MYVAIKVGILALKNWNFNIMIIIFAYHDNHEILYHDISYCRGITTTQLN